LTHAAAHPNDASEQRAVDRSVQIDTAPSESDPEGGSRRIGIDHRDLCSRGYGGGDYQGDDDNCQHLDTVHGYSCLRGKTGTRCPNSSVES
jgi:hypothetical protein